MEMQNTGIPLLPIQDMAARHYGLLPSTAEHYLDAARVCLDLHHISPKEFTLGNGKLEMVMVATVQWQPTDTRCRAAWANKDDATRDGAYSFALAAVELVYGLFAISRAETRTGADYYISPGGDMEDLENCFRLEVSGTNSDKFEVSRRLSQKIQQTKDGRSNLPALAAVVGFKAQLIAIQKVEDSS